MTDAKTATIESPPEAVDKIYAQSLFELAREQGGEALLREIAEEVGELRRGRGSDPKIQEFFRSLIIPARDKVRVLQSVFTGRINPLLLNLMLVLARKDRSNRFPQVLAAYENMMEEHFGRLQVEVYSREPLSNAEMASIEATLREVMKREPVMNAKIDPTITGGVRIRAGDKMLDATVDAQLRRMGERLNKEGASRVRSQIERMFSE